MKKCSNLSCLCLNEQPISNFWKDKRSLDGLRHMCKKCMRDRQIKYDFEHLEERKIQKKNYQTNNKDYISKRMKIYNSSRYELIKESEKIRNKNYRNLNPNVIRAISSKRRASKIEATINLSPNDKLKLKDIFLNCTTGRHEVDHIIPLNHKLVSGLHVPWNLQILTIHENRVKKNKFDGTYDNESWRKDLLLDNSL